MPIRPYLNGCRYPSDAITLMGTAFREACATLNIGSNNLSRAMLAHTVIALFESGETDRDQLADAAIKEMRGSRSAIV